MLMLNNKLKTNKINKNHIRVYKCSYNRVENLQVQSFLKFKIISSLLPLIKIRVPLIKIYWHSLHLFAKKVP